MTAITAGIRGTPASTETVKADTRSPVSGGPVLMADCATPVGGETLLSLLWRRWDGNTE